MKCPYCANALPDNATFCDGCGRRLETTPVKRLIHKLFFSADFSKPMSSLRSLLGSPLTLALSLLATVIAVISLVGAIGSFFDVSVTSAAGLVNTVFNLLSNGFTVAAIAAFIGGLWMMTMGGYFSLDLCHKGLGWLQTGCYVMVVKIIIVMVYIIGLWGLCVLNPEIDVLPLAQFAPVSPTTGQMIGSLVSCTVAVFFFGVMANLLRRVQRIIDYVEDGRFNFIRPCGYTAAASSLMMLVFMFYRLIGHTSLAVSPVAADYVMIPLVLIAGAFCVLFVLISKRLCKYTTSDEFDAVFAEEYIYD